MDLLSLKWTRKSWVNQIWVLVVTVMHRMHRRMFQICMVTKDCTVHMVESHSQMLKIQSVMICLMVSLTCQKLHRKGLDSIQIRVLHPQTMGLVKMEVSCLLMEKMVLHFLAEARESIHHRLNLWQNHKDLSPCSKGDLVRSSSPLATWMTKRI